jgi:hypothetical protein
MLSIQGLPSSRNLLFDILKCISPIRMKIWMTESPALREDLISRNKIRTGNIRVHQTYCHPFFDFMKAGFIQLSNKTWEIGMLEHVWQNRRCEFVHILYNVGKKGHKKRKNTYFYNKTVIQGYNIQKKIIQHPTHKK